MHPTKQWAARCMRVAIVLACVWFCVLFAGSTAVAFHGWNEAILPMTPEKYGALCGNAAQRYPEIGYLFGAVLAGPRRASPTI